MKKFIVYLVVILVAVATGFTVFYLTRDNEKISISTSSIYMREGEEVDDLDIMWENKKAFSDYDVLTSDSRVATYDKERGVLKAVGGGIATITFRTSNLKFRNLSCQVYVGNGTLSNPYYITTAEQLRSIGAVKEVNGVKTVEYGLDKCYKLVSDINLIDGFDGTGFWIPIGTGTLNGFTGDFNGNGYTISNVSVDREKFLDEIKDFENYNSTIEGYNTYTNAGLFGIVGPNGNIRNLKINNIIVHGNFAYNGINGNIGTVAGINYGTIDRVQVNNGHIDIINAENVGGLVGLSRSKEATVQFEDESGNVSTDYVRYNSKVTRSSANVIMGIEKVSDETVQPNITGVMGNVGGLVGNNYGGIIIYSYSNGEIYLNDAAKNYGGIVGINSYIGFTDDATTQQKYMYPYSGAHVKDCYSVVTLKNSSTVNSEIVVGGVIGTNIDRPAIDLEANGLPDVEKAGYVNKIIGNYYNKENLNYVNAETPVPASVTAVFIGIGKNINDGSIVTAEDKEYYIMGKTKIQLQVTQTYVSHKDVELIYNEDTGNYDKVEEIVRWKFDTIWFINAAYNEGYPYLNLANIEYTDDLDEITDGYTIKSYSDLTKMKLDGSYYIANDIDCGDNVWIPIGNFKSPFVGSLKAGAYIKNGKSYYYSIKNLKTASSTDLDEVQVGSIPYAGLFGVTSNSKSGSIENVTLIKPSIINGVVSGGIVATNGYIKTTGKVSEVINGMTVKDCLVLGGTIRGIENVGGIVGANYGNVTGCVVSDYEDENLNTIKTEIILFSTTSGYAGGIAGINNSGSSITGSRIGGVSSVTAKSTKDKIANVEVGGITGQNLGLIENCNVLNYGGISIIDLNGSIGGIAGVNRGRINNIVVSTDIYSKTTEGTYAGGIAGKTIEDSSISNGLVKKSAVTGYYAGGLVAYVNYSKPNYSYAFSVDKNMRYTLSENDKDTISVCGVESTAVTGETSGGFAATVENGIIRNCYTQATLNGVSGSSIKAGFVVDLNLNKSNVGIIINCYASVGFGNGNGKSFAITPKEIFKDPVFTINVDALKRSAGYCFDFVYNKDSGGTEPSKDFIVNIWDNLFNQDDLPSAKTSDMKGVAPKKFTDRNFNTDVWSFSVNAYPELSALNKLVEDMNITWE